MWWMIFKVFGVAFLVWLIWSFCTLLEVHQRGIWSLFGKVRSSRIIRPGRPIFIPRFWASKLVRIPADNILVTYRADPGDEIRTSDNVICNPEVGLYFNYPFDEVESIKKMLENNIPIPLSNKDEMGILALHDKYEDVVMDAVQNAFAQFASDEVAKKKREIVQIIEDELRIIGGVMHLTGIIGVRPDVKGPGLGWVEVKIESTGLPEPLSRAMAEPAVAKHELAAAKLRADIQAQNAGVTAKAYSEWLQTNEGQSASDPMKKQMLEVIRQRTLSSDGNYQEQAIELRGPNGETLPPSIQYLSFGGGGAGLLIGGGSRRGNQGNRDKTPKSSSSKRPEDMDDEEAQEWAERQRRGRRGENEED